MQLGFLICWKILTNHYGMAARTIKSDHGLSEAGYDKIIEWARSILPEGIKLKEKFYAAKSMMKPLGLGYQKIDMCPNFYMLYYLKNIELTECITCGHSRYKPRIGIGKTLVAYKKLRYFPITPRLQRYSCHQRPLSTWHDTNHILQLMEWWCILLTAKHGNTLIVCILTFQLNQGTCLGLCTYGFNLFGDMYKARVHVFIYGHTRSEQSGVEYRCLSSTVDWWVDAAVVLWSFDLWYLEKTEFCYESGFDVDYQWFFSLWNGFWLKHAWKTSMSILYEQQQGIHDNKRG